MKTLFIPAISKSQINDSKLESLSKKLPKNIAIAYSIQFKNIAEQAKQILSKTHKITKMIQVLGCSNPKFSKETQAILLIGSGRFHAIGLAIETKKTIYILDKNKLTKISKKEIQTFEKLKKGSYIKFLNAQKVGIIVSTKPGQQKLKQALNLKFKDKNNYYFIANDLNTNEFENFGLESWVNTACPRMDLNHPSVINMNDIKL